MVPAKKRIVKQKLRNNFIDFTNYLFFSILRQSSAVIHSIGTITSFFGYKHARGINLVNQGAIHTTVTPIHRSKTRNLTMSKHYTTVDVLFIWSPSSTPKFASKTIKNILRSFHWFEYEKGNLLRSRAPCCP